MPVDTAVRKQAASKEAAEAQLEAHLEAQLEELSAFKALLIKGLPVLKIHNNPGIFGDRSRAQILFMDADLTALACARETCREGYHQDSAG
jgi:hypothetical protein